MVETNPNPKQKRNKVILIIVLGFLVICVIICVVGYFSLRKSMANVIKVDPIQAKNIATQITDYELPNGYKEMAGTSVFGLLTAEISDEYNKNTIWLVQAPSDGLPDPEKFLRNAIAYQKNNPINWTANDMKIFVIRNTKSSITSYSGITQDGKTYHAWAGKFIGKAGPGQL
jgi:hypothetical protein